VLATDTAVRFVVVCLKEVLLSEDSVTAGTWTRPEILSFMKEILVVFPFKSFLEGLFATGAEV
jgi:hypothetical protein